MTQDTITFDQLPQAVSLLLKEVDTLKQDFKNFTSNQEENPIPVDERMITIPEACEILKIQRVTLWRYSKAGKVKIYGIGNRRLLKYNEVMDALKLKK